MNLIRLLPVILSCILMAAHFSRADNLALVIVSLAAPLLLLLKRPWVARVFQIALLLSAVEWIRTLVAIAVRREDMGESWLRMAVILGAVALITALSGFVFKSKGLRERYSL